METGIQIQGWLVTAIVSLVVALVTGGASWLLVRPQGKKAEAEAAESLTQTAMVLLARYKIEYERDLKRISKLEGELAEIRSQLVEYKNILEDCKNTSKDSERYIKYLQRGIAILVAQICKLGYTPDWIVSENFLDD